MQAFECKFLARDFEQLCNEIKIFNILFRGGELIMKCHSLNFDSQALSTALEHTFQGVYLAIVARISESDAVQTM